MRLYRIGELAAKAKVSTRTIDYYTRLGLLTPEQRSGSNYRMYSEQSLHTLQWIDRWKRDHYSLEEIKEKLAATRNVHHLEVLDKMLSIQENINQVERDLKELEPLLGQFRKNKELREALQDMAAKGVSVAQVMLTILNESMHML